MTGFATRTWEGITIPAAGTYVLDQAHKRIGFLAKHMTHARAVHADR